jgi:hypothetical protein
MLRYNHGVAQARVPVFILVQCSDYCFPLDFLVSPNKHVASPLPAAVAWGNHLLQRNQNHLPLLGLDRACVHAAIALCLVMMMNSALFYFELNSKSNFNSMVQAMRSPCWEFGLDFDAAECCAGS